MRSGPLMEAPAQSAGHAHRLCRSGRALGRLPQPGRGLWHRRACARCFAGGGPGAGFRRPLLGLSGGRSAHRQLRRSSARCTAPTPGFYLLVGPNWKGECRRASPRCSAPRPTPASSCPRVFQDDTPEDKRAIQAVVARHHDVSAGGIRRQDEEQRIGPSCRKCRPPPSGEEETQWVLPEKFVDELPPCWPMRRRCRARRRAMRRCWRVLAAAKDNPAMQAGDDRGRKGGRGEAGEAAVPVPQLRPAAAAHWTTISNEAAFGTDYFTRTAVAKSNILVNAPNETKYFYQDLDAAGARLNSAQSLHRDIRQGRHAAGERLLVAVDLQRASFLHRQSDQPLLGRHQEQGSEIRRRRLADDLRAGRGARPIRSSAPTGCRRRRAISRSISAPTGRRRRSWRVHGRRRRAASGWSEDRCEAMR